METIVSGIRPTGHLHLGNFFGAIRNFIFLQENNTCFFFIADYHSLTTHPTPENLHQNVRQIFIEFLALGIDPEKATIYVQSDVPETLELYLFFNMNAYLGELQQCTSFKEKARQQPHNVNAGLLTYPTLMAADILIHKASKVPVGKDQEQHLEMTRDFAARFNRLYKVDYFPLPQAFNFGGQLIKIPGLDGTGKMGKSEGNAIYFVDSPEVIEKKVMRAVTDSGPTKPFQPKSEPVQNLFTFLQLFSTPDTLEYFEEQYNNCTIRYSELKKQLAADINKFIAPYRERIAEISAQTDYVSKIARLGKEKARQSASQTIHEVRQIIGFKPL